MEISMLVALFIASAVRMAVPLLLGTLGESLTERAGNLNLGVEGLMMMGAATGFIAAHNTDNILIAVLAGMLGSGFGALLYAILTITFRTKQDVTGLALTIFGSGFANTLGKALANTRTPAGIREFAQGTPLHLPLETVGQWPVIGPVLTFIDTALLQHNWFVYLTFLAGSRRLDLPVPHPQWPAHPDDRRESGSSRCLRYPRHRQQVCPCHCRRYALRPWRRLHFSDQCRHLPREHRRRPRLDRRRTGHFHPLGSAQGHRRLLVVRRT